MILRWWKDFLWGKYWHISWFSTAVNKLCPQPHQEGKGLFISQLFMKGSPRQNLKTGPSTGTEAETVEEHCWLSHSVCISFCKRRSSIRILGRCSSVGGVLYEQAWGPKVDAQHHVNRAYWHQPHYNHSFQEHLQLHKEFKVSRGIHEAVSQ